MRLITHLLLAGMIIFMTTCINLSPSTGGGGRSSYSGGYSGGYVGGFGGGFSGGHK